MNLRLLVEIHPALLLAGYDFARSEEDTEFERVLKSLPNVILKRPTPQGFAMKIVHVEEGPLPSQGSKANDRSGVSPPSEIGVSHATPISPQRAPVPWKPLVTIHGERRSRRPIPVGVGQRKFPPAQVGDRFGCLEVISLVEGIHKGRVDERVSVRCTVCKAEKEGAVYNLRKLKGAKGCWHRSQRGGSPPACEDVGHEENDDPVFFYWEWDEEDKLIGQRFYCTACASERLACGYDIRRVTLP